MLLVSRFSQAGDGGSATRARALLNRVLVSQIDPRVATKPWHIDCVFADRAPYGPGGGFETGHDCGCAPQKYYGRIASVISDANFPRSGSFTERTFETVAVDTDVD